jgi:hypothetical protein
MVHQGKQVAMETAAPSTSCAAGWEEVDKALTEYFQGRAVPEFPRTAATLPAMQRVVRAIQERTREAELVRDEKLRASKVYQQEGELRKLAQPIWVSLFWGLP